MRRKSSQKRWSTAVTSTTESSYSMIKSALVLALAFFSSSAIATHGIVHQHLRTESTVHNTRGDDGWSQCQKRSGSASFTAYKGCQYPCKFCVYCFMVLYSTEPRLTETSFYSVWRNNVWLYGCGQHVCIWCLLGCRRRLRALLQDNRRRGSILAK